MYTPRDEYLNRPTRAEISIPNLLSNFAAVQSLTGPEVKVMAMVKANAYGHGIERIALELLRAGAHSLGVAYLEEAVYLRKKGITAPILAMGGINTEQISDFITCGVDITCSSPDKSRAISAAAAAMGRKAYVHLKIDTGMERIGVHWYNAEKFISETAGLPGIEIRGIYSHLAKADTDSRFTEEQISRFDGAVEYMDRLGIMPEQIHLANSAGIIRYRQAHYNMVRPGIMLYGYNPFMNSDPPPRGEPLNLKPVMTLKTKVSYFKVCPPGTGISYGHTYLTESQTRVVTLPIGYGDGYSRALSNKGQVVIRGRRYPVAGIICMDQTMIDVGPEGTAFNGDDVLIFGEMEGQSLPLEELCGKTGTITYEMLCGVSSRVPRIYIDN